MIDRKHVKRHLCIVAVNARKTYLQPSKNDNAFCVSRNTVDESHMHSCRNCTPDIPGNLHVWKCCKPVTYAKLAVSAQQTYLPPSMFENSSESQLQRYHTGSPNIPSTFRIRRCMLGIWSAFFIFRKNKMDKKNGKVSLMNDKEYQPWRKCRNYSNDLPATFGTQCSMLWASIVDGRCKRGKTFRPQ